MEEAEFDKFADEYRAIHAKSVGISGEAPEYFAEYKVKDVAAEFAQSAQCAGHGTRIIDFGSGSGASIPFFARHFPQSELTCLDVSTRSLEVAQERFPGMARFEHFDGSRIPFPEGSFDVAFAACVFHHIDHAEHVALIGEMRRVLGPAGLLLIYEHNPYNPLTVRVVNQCPFDANARLVPPGALKRNFELAGFASARIRHRLFFPRALAALRPVERHLSWLPLGGQYYVVATKE